MKKMLINAIHPEEIRVAVVEEGLLKELHIESALKEQLRGNIFKARISKIDKGLDAVFVDYGREKNGLLPIGDINPAFIPGAEPGMDIASVLRTGLEIPVQVSREEKAAKGALLTMDISIPGRYMVLIPKHEIAGISRKIDDEAQRKRLKEIIEQLQLPSDMGLIVRTAGMDKTKAELSKDINYLLRLWKSIERDYIKMPCPCLIYREGDIIIRSIRDYFTADMTEILIDDEETYKRATIFMKSVMPRHRGRIKLYKQPKPLFTKYDLEQQIQGIYDKKVKLKSGGTIVIESTEAMVVIDVNSGQIRNSKNIEDTAFLTDMEAADEIARQLVLRDLGGLVVIDFIDMRTKANIRTVEKALKDGLKDDRAHIVMGRISKFGILELSREKLSSTLLEKSYVQCPGCEGTGIVRSVESSAFMALREIQLFINRNKARRLLVGLPGDVALYLLNQQRRHLARLEQEFSAEVQIYSLGTLKHGQIQIDLQEPTA